MGFVITPRSGKFTVHRIDGSLVTPNCRDLLFSTDDAAKKWIGHFFPKAKVISA